MTSSPHKAPGFGKRGLLYAGLAVIALFIVLLFAFVRWQQTQNQKKIAAHLATLRAEGFPTTGAELDAWYPDPPADQNAAPVYHQAFSQMTLQPRTNPWFFGYDTTNIFYWPNPIPPQAQAELATLVTSNLAALQLLHDGGKLTGARYPVNLSAGFNMLLPHHRMIRQASHLLSAEALNHALNGRPQPAVDSLISAMRLGHSLSNEPVIISCLTQISTYTETVRSLENILNRTTIPAQLLSPLATELERAEHSLNLTRALAGERSNGLGMFDAQLAAFTSGTTPTMREASSRSLYKLSGLQDSDIQAYLHFMNDCILASQKPPEEMMAAFRDIELAVGKATAESPWKMFLTGMLMPAIARKGDNKVEAIARLRLARLALRLYTCQAEPGNLPASLDTFPQVPLDPFDGKPLRYRRTETGFVLWSIGRDAKDQGGLPKPHHSTNDAYDIVFTVERPAKPVVK